MTRLSRGLLSEAFPDQPRLVAELEELDQDVDALEQVTVAAANGGIVAWGNVTGRPASVDAIAGLVTQSYGLSLLTVGSAESLRASLDIGAPQWADIAGKPLTFPPSAHTHVAADITNFNSVARAQVEAELVPGANITITPSGSGASRQLTIAATSGGGVTSVGGTAPISSSGGATPSISISPASTSAAGSMSAADKTKLDAVTVGVHTPTLTGLVNVGGSTPYEYQWEINNGRLTMSGRVDIDPSATGAFRMAMTLPVTLSSALLNRGGGSCTADASASSPQTFAMYIGSTTQVYIEGVATVTNNCPHFFIFHCRT